MTLLMSRQTEHRKRRREQGLCAREGCKVHTGEDAYYCSEHRHERRKYRRKRPVVVVPSEAA